MSMEADLAAMQKGADAALMGGENIATHAGRMFTNLQNMGVDLVGKGGAAFQRVQSSMQTQLDIIDRELNRIGNGIKDSALVFDQTDDDNAVGIDQSLGSDAVDLLTQGR